MTDQKCVVFVGDQADLWEHLGFQLPFEGAGWRVENRRTMAEAYEVVGADIVVLLMRGSTFVAPYQEWHEAPPLIWLVQGEALTEWPPEVAAVVTLGSTPGALFATASRLTM
jgi:hypothetical protein